MDMQKLCETVKKSLEKQYGVETIERDILQLQMYLNTIECKISQYGVELERAKKVYADADITARTLWNKVFDEAEKAYAEKKQNIENAREEIKLSQEKYTELNIKAMHDFQELFEEKEMLSVERMSEQQQKINEANRRLEEAKGKTYLFRGNKKATTIEELENELATAKHGLQELKDQTHQIYTKIENDRQEEKERYENVCAQIEKKYEEQNEAEKVLDQKYIEEVSMVQEILDDKDIQYYTFFNDESIELAVMADANAQVLETEYFVVQDKLATAIMDCDETKKKIGDLQEKFDKSNEEIAQKVEEFQSNAEMTVNASKDMLDDVTEKAKGLYKQFFGVEDEQAKEEAEDVSEESSTIPKDFSELIGNKLSEEKIEDIKKNVKKATVKGAKKLIKTFRDFGDK